MNHKIEEKVYEVRMNVQVHDLSYRMYDFKLD